MDRNCAEQLPKMQCGFIDFVCSFVYKVMIAFTSEISTIFSKDNYYKQWRGSDGVNMDEDARKKTDMDFTNRELPLCLCCNSPSVNTGV